MVFNKITTLIVALSFVFVGEAFAHRHGRHSEGNGEESSHRVRRHFHQKRDGKPTHQRRKCFRERIQGDENRAPQERRQCRRGHWGPNTPHEKRTFKHHRCPGKPTFQRRGGNHKRRAHKASR